MLTFKQFIEESRGVQGEMAEIQLYNLLKQYHKLPSDQAKPAGFSAHDVDLSFLDKDNKKHLLEVKYDLPDFGQFELKWNRQRGWHFKDYDANSTDPVSRERARIVEQMRSAGIEKSINKFWNKPPKLYTLESLTFEDRAWDAKTFTDQYIDIDSSFIGRYYGSKGVDYINISSRNGKYGLYHFGNDPAQTGCSAFKPGKSVLRVRIKSRSSSNPRGYGFLGALKISNLPKSTIDLSNPKDIEKALGGYK